MPPGSRVEHDLDALGLEAGAEQPRLRRLAGAVEALEGDEHLPIDYGDAVIVTGGAGFIGSHVVDALVARGDEVHVVDDLSHGRAGERPGCARRCTCTTSASRSTRSSRATGAEAIVHLAAQADVRVSVEDPVATRRSTSLGTVNVLEAARQVGARVVFASTGGAIYGECARPAREDDPLPAALAVRRRRSWRARGTSVRSRASTARPTSRCASATSTGRARIRTARPASSRSSSGACATGEPCRIFGDGAQSRDYVYVGDVAARDALGARRRDRRRVQRRHRHGDVGARALRDLSLGRRLRRGGRSRAGARRRARAERARRRARGRGARDSAPARRSRTACARPGSS